MEENQIVNEDGKIEENKDGNKAQPEHSTEKEKGTMIPKARLDQEIGKRKDLESILNSMVEELIEDIPEEYRDLVPQVPPTQKISWIRNATKKGLFLGNQNTDGPDSKRPTGKQPVDLENMSDFQMRKSGYKT